MLALRPSAISQRETETSMSDSSPIHALRANLEAARLQAVEELAAKGASLSPDGLQKLASLQLALTAVREEIEAHDVKIGGGGEVPLK
ncbi:conserved hypothetical protein [Methylocella tundrae]|uniref:Uncharacterized protein n=2 Tax=Methylocella tundrae TaxID=227605 RepID=A0A8B6M0S3_METTU|nr:conserved hypothetical protein [Methylocella tundrae]VTZ48059.1 conserved hypothetical protein [Methylocella tundrae]